MWRSRSCRFTPGQFGLERFGWGKWGLGPLSPSLIAMKYRLASSWWLTLRHNEIARAGAEDCAIAKRRQRYLASISRNHY
jgi:hypothetical protein